MRAVWFATTIGRMTREMSEAMMNATGRTVVQVLSGPTRQMLRRSRGLVAIVGVIPSAANRRCARDNAGQPASPPPAASFLRRPPRWRVSAWRAAGRSCRARARCPSFRRPWCRPLPPVRAICLPCAARDILTEMVANDRREFQRLRLAKPILALMDGQNALILDIGVGGAYIEHYGSLASGTRFKLVFRWQGADIELLCEVRRARAVRSGGDNMSIVSHSGVLFIEAVGVAGARLNGMMATFVGRVLAAQRANA